MYEKKVTILLPTYNEANNIAPLLYALKKSLAGTNTEYEILIIDDSTDQTPQEIKKLSEIYPEMRYIHRSKESRTGLATAFAKGFGLANGKYILCMDSDLQHPPEVVPRLIEAIEASENDMIIATRYRTGGGADGLNTFYRKLVSKLSRMASWAILPVTRKSTDPGSGFFIVTTDLIRNIPFDGLRGFKILIDILTRAPLARVGEIPYIFRKRENEKSKATFKQGVEFFRHILYLRYDEDIYNPKINVEKNNIAVRGKRKFHFSAWVTDIFAVAFIFSIGWFIVGYFTDYAYILSSYEDWIYHAFRIETLQNDGITSWNHEWGTGMNIWRLYQYGQHHLVLWAVALMGVPIPKMLIFFGVGIYIGLRILLYCVLRIFKVTPLFALLGVTTSFTFVQEWIAMQDFSIYVAFACVPLYIFLWVKTFNNLKMAYFLAAVTGALWSLHPIMGFSMSILFGFLILFSPLKGNLKKLTVLAVVYSAGATPFLAQYFTAGYFFTNPLFRSPIYLSYSVLPIYGGLSLIYWILFGASWVLFIFQSSKIAAWVKVLMVYCSFYLVLIYLGKNYFLPEFLVQFQFSRGVTAIAFILALCFAVVFYQTMRNIRSRFILSIIVVLIAINVVHAIDIASGYYIAPLGQTIDNPVARFFEKNEIPSGSVYYDNVSEASYFSKPGVRFVTSYNEHMQPHPYSTRLNILIKNSTIFTGISASHLKNIEDYATVLGIEYLFLNGKSPFVKGLTEKVDPLFSNVAEIQSETLSDSVVVLRYKDPIYYAYVGEKDILPQDFFSEFLDNPTLYVATYQPWDETVSRMAEIIHSGILQPLPLVFHATDRISLAVNQDILSQYDNPIVLLNQSYDQNWAAENVLRVVISSTKLRLMALEVPKDVPLDENLQLKNSWPKWHWPVQSIGIITITLTLLHYLSRRKYKK